MASKCMLYSLELICHTWPAVVSAPSASGHRNLASAFMKWGEVYACGKKCVMTILPQVVIVMWSEISGAVLLYPFNESINYDAECIQIE